MLGSAAIVEVQEGLGFRTDRAEEILRALNEAQQFFEKGKTLPQFLIERHAELALVADTNYVALPDDFIKIVDDEAPYFRDEDDGAHFLEWARYDQILKLFPPETASPIVPRVFTIVRPRLYVAPTPSDATTLVWSYYKRDDEIVEGDENLWLLNAPYLLIGRAGSRMAHKLHATQAKKEFDLMTAEWARAQLGETIEADIDGPVQMGSMN